MHGNPELVDIGANLTHESFSDDLNGVLARARACGIRQLIITGASVNGSEMAVTLAESDPELYATVGIHPHHAEETSEAALSRFRTLARNNKVKSIGETGLDFFRDFSPRPTQIASFERHIDLAVELGLPLFLHERDAYPTFAEVLGPRRAELTNVIVHCFTGEAAALEHYLDLDCHIGITGWICDERRGAHLAELVKLIPANRLMLETDSPYLLPRNIRPRPKSRRNEPRNLTVVCEFTAEILGISPAELARQTTENAQRFFRIPPACE